MKKINQNMVKYLMLKYIQKAKILMNYLQKIK